MSVQSKQLINLLPQEEFAGSTIGRILKWLLSTFRIIVIATEVVVMAAFLSRFYLDAKIADLNGHIKRSSTLVEATLPFQRLFTSSQKKLSIAKNLISKQEKISANLGVISSHLPIDVTLTSYTAKTGGATIRGQTPSELSISQLIANLGSINQFSNFELSQINTSDSGGLLTFSLDFKTQSNQSSLSSK